MRPRWKTGPVEIVLVRHGHSVGNLADAQAREQVAERLDLDVRDADVELSETGQAQADAVKDWLAGVDGERGPTVVLSSPYRRAAETARRVVANCGLVPVLDERLRERDLGVFDGLTGLGIKARYPEEAERRQHLGKFYYQPPSGESWADVVLRVRSLLDDLRHGYDGERVWLFTHQAVISAFRYVLEDVSQQDLLEIDRQTPIPNASITRYSRAVGCLPPRPRRRAARLGGGHGRLPRPRDPGAGAARAGGAQHLRPAASPQDSTRCRRRAASAMEPLSEG